MALKKLASPVAPLFLSLLFKKMITLFLHQESVRIKHGRSVFSLSTFPIQKVTLKQRDICNTAIQSGECSIVTVRFQVVSSQFSADLCVTFTLISL